MGGSLISTPGFGVVNIIFPPQRRSGRGSSYPGMSGFYTSQNRTDLWLRLLRGSPKAKPDAHASKRHDVHLVLQRILQAELGLGIGGFEGV